MKNEGCQVKNALPKKKISGWSLAIADAKRKIKELQFTIKVYSERRKRGEVWPGERE